MRHFLLPSPVSTLAFGMGATAPMRVLIATTGSLYRLVACLRRTSSAAVAIAVITVAAHEHRGAAAGAQVASSGNIHWHSRPMESRRRRALREILCRQRRRCWGCGARHRNWLGGWDRCRACVSTGQSAFYPIANAGATFTQTKRALRSSASARPDTALWRSLASDPCRASLARRWIALQSIRRKPCGRKTAKPAYSCLKIKNQNHTRLAPAFRPQNSSPPGFCGNATPLTPSEAPHSGTGKDPEIDDACPLSPCWLFPAVRLAYVVPIRQCPA